MINLLNLPNDKILDLSKQKKLADNICRFDENNRKFSKLPELSRQDKSLNSTKRQNFRLVQTKEFADDIFRFDENNNVLQMGKNTVGKGEIACYKQFLLFPQYFQRTCTADT